MTDLEAAADAALLRVKELAGAVEEAEEACEDLERELSRARAQLEADGEAVREKAEALVDAAREQSAQLGHHGGQAEAALAALAGAVRSAQSEGDQAVEAAATAASGFAEHVSDARAPAADRLEQGRADAHALVDHASEVQTALERALAEAGELVGGTLVGDLQAAQEAVRRQAAKASTVMQEELVASIEGAYERWDTKVAELEAFMADFFDDARRHGDETVTRCLEQCTQGHSEAVEEMGEAVRATLLPSIQELAQAVEVAGALVGETAEGLTGGLGATASAVEDATRGLEGVRQLLASYTFVQG
jgi:hypothetical protein